MFTPRLGGESKGSRVPLQGWECFTRMVPHAILPVRGGNGAAGEMPLGSSAADWLPFNE